MATGYFKPCYQQLKPTRNIVYLKPYVKLLKSVTE